MAIKYMNIQEFMDFGYLQEANRQFFHPLGLALEVSKDSDTGKVWISGVWDYRGDPEGMAFGDGMIDGGKAINIIGEQARRSGIRQQHFGYNVQPITPIEEQT